MDLRYTTMKVDGNLIVFDFEARQSVRRLVDTPPDTPFIELDLSGCEFIDSAGIELLHRLHMKLKSRKGHLRLINANLTVREVLDVCGVATLMGVEMA